MNLEELAERLKKREDVSAALKAAREQYEKRQEATRFEAHTEADRAILEKASYYAVNPHRRGEWLKERAETRPAQPEPEKSPVTWDSAFDAMDHDGRQTLRDKLDEADARAWEREADEETA